MKSTLLTLVTFIFIIISIILLQNQTGNETQRGRGLEVAIRNVPDFVAGLLRSIQDLFSQGIGGIGQALSDWISQFFNPAGRNVTGNTSQ